MTELTYDPELTLLGGRKNKHAGRWKGGISDGKKTANASCPKCGRIASLSQHSISQDGKVTPSLVCPFDDCDFHDYVKLVGWAERRKGTP